ncbi:50S ribosomal protein L18 [Patescibacteria group bacterium]
MNTNTVQSRKRRTRRKLKAVGQGRPRLSVNRTNLHFYAQIIDDTKGKTLVAASDHEIKDKSKNRSEQAAEVGKIIAEKAEKAKIGQVVFDRGSYAYHGRVKSFADAARENKLKF